MTVFNLGASPIRDVRVEALDSEGQPLAVARIPALDGSSGLLPVKRDVTLELVDGSDRLRVVVSTADEVPELYTHNNCIEVQTEERACSSTGTD